jgi:hypothetical protein
LDICFATRHWLVTPFPFLLCSMMLVNNLGL